jgi:hypothetical protein
MNRSQRDRVAAGTRRSGALRTLALFVEMAIEEWRRLVADVGHAFEPKGSHPDGAAVIIEEKRFGEQ